MAGRTSVTGIAEGGGARRNTLSGVRGCGREAYGLTTTRMEVRFSAMLAESSAIIHDKSNRAERVPAALGEL